MRVLIIALILSQLLFGCSPASQEPKPQESVVKESVVQESKPQVAQAALSYPETARGEVIDNYFGSSVADPYRWLEDDRSEKTKNWVERQNAVTFSYLDKIPYRDKIKDRLLKIWNYEKVSSPFRKEATLTFIKTMAFRIKPWFTAKK